MDRDLPTDRRPSDRAGPCVGLLSVHTSPLEQPGTGDSGGMNVYVAATAERLVRRGAEVHVFTRTAGADLPPSLETEAGVQVHHVPAGPPHAAKAELANHLCAFYLGFAAHPVTARLDVVHAHYWMSGWVGRQARGRLGIPFVQSFHTLARAKNAALAPGEAPEPALRVAAEDRVAAAADLVVAPTADEAALLVDRYGVRPGAVSVVEPGVDLDVFAPTPDRAGLRAALGGGAIVLFAGRLQALKGPDVAVRTLAALDAHLPSGTGPVRLVCVGGPSGERADLADGPALRALAARLGVADRVAVLGPRPQPELAALYQAADVVVMPSRSESFGLVALEAQACGTPVVASRVGGLPAAVGPSAGTLVDGPDPQDWARAVAPYLLDADRRSAAGAAGRRHAEAHGWDRTTTRLLAAYQRLVSPAAAMADSTSA